MLTLSNSEARHLILTNQGLATNFFGDGKTATLKVIEHLGYVQIDTISVVERAHHHTIWTRTPDYHKAYLDELLESDRQIFEYWSHAAAYLPMKDYRFSLIRKNRYVNAKEKWFKNKKMLRFVYDRIKAEGPLQSKDFEEKKVKQGWWEWKDSKRALEQLFMEGGLMVSKRAAFQKVYDLAERVLPKKVNTATPSMDEYAEYLVEKSIRANGLVAMSEVGYLRPFARKSVVEVIKSMEEGKKIIPLKIEGIAKDIFYTTDQSLQRASKAEINKEVKILSPFDNSVIQRARMKKFFDFDYTIECYVPEAKRKFGYFCLPVLYGDKFIGRIDCKAERSEKTLIVKNMFYEKKVKARSAFKKELNTALNTFATFNGCARITTL